jgi:UDP-N-acetylmuramyl pentapeptide synthase
MRYTARDVPRLLRNPLGRLQLAVALLDRAWPVLASVAGLHRRLVLRRTRIVAVVGSYGKTTTMRAIRTALGLTLDPRLQRNAQSSVALHVLRVRPRDPFAVLEVGIQRPGQMGRHARALRPDAVVFTSVGSEHLRSFAGLEAIRDEKALMAEALGSSGLAVLNGDDPLVRALGARLQARVITIGFDPANDVRAADLAVDWPRGSTFTLHTSSGSRVVRTRLVGRPMVYALLAAVAVGLDCGRPLDAVLAALEDLPPAPARLQTIALASGVTLLDDVFKGGAETFHSALDALAAIPARRRIVVLGEIQEPPRPVRGAYRDVGRRAGEIASRMYLIGDMTDRYVGPATGSGLPRAEIVRLPSDLHQIVARLEAELEPGDVVLLKGRGSQRLDRIALALSGRTVRCAVTSCSARWTRCETCPMLARGWDGRPVIV